MKAKILYLFVLCVYGCLPVKILAQDPSIQRTFELASKTHSFSEGFYHNKGGNEFIYQSLRDDITASLLARCTDGKMAIQWETAVLPSEISSESVGFLWLAAVDHTTEGKKFKMYINDKYFFTYTSSAEQLREFRNDNGGVMGFTTISTDQHGDYHGYMWVSIPKKWLIPGKGQTIKIVGEAEGSQSWIIVYQAKDALSFLLNSAKYSAWSEFSATLKNNEYQVTFRAPSTKADEQITVNYNKVEKTYKLLLKDKQSVASFTLPKSVLAKPVIIKDEIGKILSVSRFGETENRTIMIPKSLLNVKSNNYNDTIFVKTHRSYKPVTIGSMADLAQGAMAKSKIYLMNSSHQDIAWMDSPENCIIARDTMLLTPLFEIGSRDPNYRFDVEDALMIKEYITRHPDKRNLVQKMLTNGNISCGSTYIQPYEEMYSGEALARQFYFGTRWLKKEFNYDADTYWNEDVPGRTLQMPQIMRKAGTKNLMLSRQEKGLYHWYSPDGSYVTAFSPGHYGDAYVQLNKTFFDAALFVSQQALYYGKYYNSLAKNPVVPVLSDWDMSAAKDYSSFINQWHSINQLEVKENQVIPIKLPEIKIVTAPEFFTAVEKENTQIPVIKGERPALWLYIHGPTHHKAITASREADILLPMAEKFATANALVKGNFNDYPYEKLNNAWEAKIYPDHGWGGKNGQITDDLFLEKFQFARSEAKAILDQSLRELASSVITDSKRGIPVVIFNSLNWLRSGTVTLKLKLEKGKDITVHDHTGIKSITAQSANGEISFPVQNIPPCGYKTYYLNYIDKVATTNTPKDIMSEIAENNFYSIKFGKGGLTSIYDKETKTELLDITKFLGGEIFTMKSVGTGAGEFADIQQPTMEGFDKTSLHAGNWQIVESNDILNKYAFRCKIRNAVIEETLTLFHKEKRLDFAVGLLNFDGEIYREFRMAMPLKMNNGQVSYEVPFGVVNVGKDEMEGTPGERHKTLCKDMHPRGIMNWISASNSQYGVTLSSSVAVADWIDPTTNPAQNIILQPLLLASRRSCHPEGNEYLQTGDHTFEFSLTSHNPGWENGYKTALGANEKMQMVINPAEYKSASLPTEMSFFSTDKQNIMISTVKLAEEANGFVVRLYDIEGKDTEVKINCFKPMHSVWQTDLLENPLNEVLRKNEEAFIKVGHHAIETFLFKN